MRRHAAFALALAPRIVVLFAAGLPTQRAIVAEGVKALQEAGYRSHAQLPRQRAPEGRVRDLLRLPPVQQKLEDALVAAGFGVDRVAEIMATIANGDFEDPHKAAVQIKALELRMKLTTGFAPTKSANAHFHGSVDNFFDDAAFSSAPPIDVEVDE